MKVFYTLIICFITTLSFGQEKQIDRVAMQKQLTEVNAEIQDLSEKITAVEDRLELVGENEKVHPEILEGFRQLKAKKEKLERVAYSINHALNENQLKTEGDEK